MLGLNKGCVAIYPHEKEWEINAAQTIFLIKAILGDVCVDAQHIGSTAIKQIKAKPIIDIVAAVKTLGDVIPFIPLLEKNGIDYRREEKTGQLLFIIGNAEIKTHHIHIVEYDSKNYRDYLNFRDYLNAISEKAREYEKIKISLAELYPDNRKEYTAGKAELIKRILSEAEQWRSDF